jgi:two-component sensor histidine kinase
VTPPVRKGFGAQILERVAPKDLAGSCELAYDPSGLRYELRAPAGEVGERAEPERRVAA